MKNVFASLMITLFGMILTFEISAQDAASKKKQPVKVPATAEAVSEKLEPDAQEDEKPPVEVGTQFSSYSLVFCTDDIKKCLVFDSDGRYMANVRSIGFHLQLPNHAICNATTYEGLYAPTNVASKPFTVKSIRAVTPAKFMEMVDAINSGNGTLAAGGG